MSTTLERYNPGADGPAFKHFPITPADTDLTRIPRALRVTVEGQLVIRDADDVDVAYPVTAGEVFTFRAKQVRSATTATVVGWE